MTEEYTVTVKYNKHMIELESGFDYRRFDIARKIVNLEDQAVREALIKLGWTPPVKY